MSFPEEHRGEPFEIATKIKKSVFKLSFLHQNVCSLSNKIDQMEFLLSEENPDFAIFTEHGLKVGEVRSVKLLKYQYVSSYCRESFKGGGVIILSGENTFADEIILPEDSCKEKCFEAAVCKAGPIIDTNTCATYIVGVYRSPSGSFDDFLFMFGNLLEYLCRPGVEVVIMGDLNIDSLQDSSNLGRLLDLISIHGLHLAKCGPTRIQGNRESAIDHVITSSELDGRCSVSIVNHAVSDHFGQKLLFDGERRLKQSVYKRVLTKARLNCLAQRLEAENWQDIYNNNLTVDDTVSLFIRIVERNLNLVCPFICTKPSSSGRPKWLTRGIITSSRKLKEMHFQFRTTQDENFKIYYKQYRKIYQKLIRLAKARYVTDKLANAKNLQSETWKIVNQTRPRLGNSVRAPPRLSVDGLHYDKPEDIVQLFNSRFSQIKSVLKLRDGVAPAVARINNEKLLEIPPVCEYTVTSILRNLKATSGVGIDNIPPVVLKHCASTICPPLTHILNKSFSAGSFPEQLKIAKVTPVYKKGDRSDPDNYRPISILPVLSKVFERHVYSILMEYLERNSILSESQFGFRKGRSTVKAAVDLVRYILDAIDTKKQVVGTFLDLTRAFDCVNSDVLLKILFKYGIQDKALKWFETFLLHRRQLVQLKIFSENTIKVEQSSTSLLQTGVPQGSILGPLLFLLYVNELSNVNSSSGFKFIQYADDTSIVCSDDTAEGVEIKNFLATNSLLQQISSLGLKVNESKSTLMRFSGNSSRVSQLSVLLGSEVITESVGVKFLGLMLDCNLNWSLHVDRTCAGLASGIFILRRLSTYCEIKTLRMVYFALVHSRLTYGIILWGSCGVNRLNRVFLMQKKAIRCILHLKNRDSCKSAFLDLKILTVPALYIYQSIKYIMEIEPLTEYINVDHIHNTRTSINFTYPLPRVRLELIRKGPVYTGRRFFNALPLTLRRIHDSREFLDRLKFYLLKKSPYSLEEYFSDTNIVDN
jgi:hypothetical protein